MNPTIPFNNDTLDRFLKYNCVRKDDNPWYDTKLCSHLFCRYDGTGPDALLVGAASVAELK